MVCRPEISIQGARTLLAAWPKLLGRCLVVLTYTNSGTLGPKKTKLISTATPLRIERHVFVPSYDSTLKVVRVGSELL